MKASDFLTKYSIQRFYHFTERANLPSIKRHGLLSLAEISRLQIPHVSFSSSPESRVLDSRYGLDDYVRLAFVDQHPMEFVARRDGRIQNSVFLSIDASILRREGLKIAGGIAYGQGVHVYDLDEAFDALDFDILYLRFDWKDPAIMARLLAARKYELLVPKRITPDLIQGL